MTYKIADDGGVVVSSFGITVGDQVATWAYGPGHPTGMLVSNFVAKASNPATGGGASGSAGSATSSAQLTVANGLVSAIKDVPITVTGGTGGGITIQGGNLARPANEAELRSLLAAHAAAGGGLSFDGTAPTITVSSTITVNLSDTGDGGCGFNFNGLRLASAGGLGTAPLIEFVVTGFPHRYLSISGLNVFGAYPNKDGGAGILVRTAGGGAVVYATFRELAGSWMAGPAIRFQGDVFESSAYALSAKDCGGNGIEFSNAGGIVSNFMVYGGNFSRCFGFGMALLDGANSVDVLGGSFVNNSLGGISASNGIRSVWGANGENTGQAFLTGSFGGYPSTINGCNLSSNGRLVSGPNAKPSQYLIMGQPRGSLVQINNYVTPYTENTQPAPTNMAVLGP